MTHYSIVISCKSNETHGGRISIIVFILHTKSGQNKWHAKFNRRATQIRIARFRNTVARATQIRSILLFSRKGTQVHSNPYKHSYQTGNKAYSTCGGAKTSTDQQFFLIGADFSLFLSRSIICADCAMERNSKKSLFRGWSLFNWQDFSIK